MPGEVSRFDNVNGLQGMSARAAAPPPATWTGRRQERQAIDRMNAAVAQSDRSAEIQARHDLNRARLAEFRIALNEELDKRKNKADENVQRDMKMRISSAIGLSAQIAATSSNPALLMALDDLDGMLLACYRMRMAGRIDS